MSANEGGHELVVCRDFLSDDAPVLDGSSVVGSSFGLITIGCEIKEWILSVDFLNSRLLLVPYTTD